MTYDNIEVADVARGKTGPAPFPVEEPEKIFILYAFPDALKHQLHLEAKKRNQPFFVYIRELAKKGLAILQTTDDRDVLQHDKLFRLSGDNNKQLVIRRFPIQLIDDLKREHVRWKWLHGGPLLFWQFFTAAIRVGRQPSLIIRQHPV